MADYEALIINNIMEQLTDIGHSLSTLKADIAVIKSEQAAIKQELSEHKASSKSEDKSGLMKALDVIKKWIFPIVLAIFLLGRQSTEYTSKSTYRYPSTNTSSMALDDTFIAHDRRFDSMLLKQIYKNTGLKD